MRPLTVVHIKVVHTIIFWVLSGCVLYTLYSGLADRITPWTWVAVALLAFRLRGRGGAVLGVAARQPAERREVSDHERHRWEPAAPHGRGV